VRGTCNILVKRNGVYEECGEPSVYSHPCTCDTCEIEPGYHLPTYWCAEHYDRLMNPRKRCWNCGSRDHYPGDLPEPDSFLESSGGCHRATLNSGFILGDHETFLPGCESHTSLVRPQDTDWTGQAREHFVAA
jgi:hypothetical protein